MTLWRSSSNWKNTVSAAARPVRVDGLASHGATGRSRPAGRRLGEAHASGARSITDTLNQTRGVIAAFLLIPAAFLFLWFLGGLSGRLRPTDRQSGQLSAAVALSGGFFVTFLVAAKLIDNITAASLAFSHTYGASPQEARITAGLAYWVQGASMAGASALLAAASILARRARQVPAWAAVFGYVLAAVGPASVALNGVPILLFFVWIVAAGIVLARSAAASPGAHRVSRERRAAHGP